MDFRRELGYLSRLASEHFLFNTDVIKPLTGDPGNSASFKSYISPKTDK